MRKFALVVALPPTRQVESDRILFRWWSRLSLFETLAQDVFKLSTCSVGVMIEDLVENIILIIIIISIVRFGRFTKSFGNAERLGGRLGYRLMPLGGSRQCRCLQRCCSVRLRRC